MECLEHISTSTLLLAGVSSENREILEFAWDRCPSNDAIASALQVVCETGQTNMVIDILKRGAQIGKNHLWAACRSGQWDTINALVEYGADITKVEMGMLQMFGHTTIIQQLADLKLSSSQL